MAQQPITACSSLPALQPACPCTRNCTTKSPCPGIALAAHAQWGGLQLKTSRNTPRGASLTTSHHPGVCTQHHKLRSQQMKLAYMFIEWTYVHGCFCRPRIKSFQHPPTWRGAWRIYNAIVIYKGFSNEIFKNNIKVRVKWEEDKYMERKTINALRIPSQISAAWVTRKNKQTAKSSVLWHTTGFGCGQTVVFLLVLYGHSFYDRQAANDLMSNVLNLVVSMQLLHVPRKLLYGAAFCLQLFNLLIQEETLAAEACQFLAQVLDTFTAYGSSLHRWAEWAIGSTKTGSGPPRLHLESVSCRRLRRGVGGVLPRIRHAVAQLRPDSGQSQYFNAHFKNLDHFCGIQMRAITLVRYGIHVEAVSAG